MFSDRPLVALTIAFALGVLIAPHGLWPAGCLLAIALVLGGVWAVSRSRLCGESVSLCAFALFGCVRGLLGVIVPSDDVSHLAPRYLTVTGVVASDVTIQAGRYAGQAPHAKFVFHVWEAGGRSQSGQVGGTGRAADEERTLAVSGNLQVRVPLSGNSANEDEDAPSGETTGPETSVQENDAGSPAARPHYGDRLTIWGRLEQPGGPRNPGGMDYGQLLRRRGIYATLAARRFEDWHFTPAAMGSRQAGSNGINPLPGWAAGLRQRILEHGRRAHDRERAGVLNGILLGDRGDLPGALNLDFERTGTAHVLATAGLHVGMVVGLLLGVLRMGRIARRPALLLTFAALILYAMMAGGRPSVVRAVIMACVVLAGLLLEREPDLPNTLALAALILLVSNPQNLFEPGFQFSFATVTTLVLLMPLVKGEVRRLGRRIPEHWPVARPLRALVEILAACFLLAVCAQIGAAPLVAYYSNEVSLVSIITNTFVVPIIAIVIAFGFGAACLSAIHPVLAWPLDRVLDVLLAYVTGVVRTCSAPDMACLNVVSPPVWLVVAYYAIVWGFALRRQHKQSPSALEK